MKDLQPNLLNDFEHQVLAKIAHHENEADFPRMEDYGLTRKQVEDYLYDYQLLLDREGSQKSQLTVYGIIAIIPTIALSAFPENMLPWGKWSLMVGVSIGVLIALAIKAIRTIVTRVKVARHRGAYPDASNYVDAVMRQTDRND